MSETGQNYMRNSGPKILAIGGGKGGVGKSLVSASLAISFAKKGYKVALVDLDLGAANLHTCLGIQSPKQGIFDFVQNNGENLEQLGVSAGINNLTLYGAGQEFWQQVRPQASQKIKLITKLQRLDADIVLLDLGAGTHVNTLDFFIFSHGGIVVVVPEPTSIENAYVFLKSVLFRKLQSIFKALHCEDKAQSLIESLSNPQITTPPYVLLNEFFQKYPDLGERIIGLIKSTNLGIIVNQVRTASDAEIGQSMSIISQRYFGFSSKNLGLVEYDDAAWKSLRNRRPMLVDFPYANSSKSLQNIADSILESFIPLVHEEKRNNVVSL